MSAIAEPSPSTRQPGAAPQTAQPVNLQVSLQVSQELDAAQRSGPLRQIDIPPCPSLLVQLRAAMASTEPDLNAVARIASNDVAMAATLLRQANGPLHAAGQPLHSVGQAMNRLGLETTEALLTGFLLRHAVPVNHPRLQRFWERSALRAAALQFIVQRLPHADPHADPQTDALSQLSQLSQMAYLYGLFSHVGQPVLLRCVRGYGSTLVEAAARIDRPFIATENANHRTDHAVVGALVAKVWHVAPTVVAAIRLHHDLEMLGSTQVDPDIQTLISAGLVAENRIAQREGMAQDADWTNHGASALSWLGLTSDDLSDWDEELQTTLDAV